MIIKEEPIDSSNFIKRSYYCDICKIELQDTLTILTSFPQIKIFRCPKCNREYNIRDRGVIYDKY